MASSSVLTAVKLVYYRLFAAAYGAALRTADCIAVNGSWTRAHIEELLAWRLLPPLWAVPKLPEVCTVYPPCDTESFSALPLRGRRRFTMVSLAQFRPEKDHSTQLRLLRRLLDEHPELAKGRAAPLPADDQRLRLVLIGGCRNEGDERRIAALREEAAQLGVEAHVEWAVNASFETVLMHLADASIGLSTMVDEHFGINVVEFMAAGLLTLSHASAGPLLDIAVPVDGHPTGYHASDVASFAKTAYRMMHLPEEDDMAVRVRARQRAMDTFSAAAFEAAWRSRFWLTLCPGMPAEFRVHSPDTALVAAVASRAQRRAEAVRAEQEAEERLSLIHI